MTIEPLSAGDIDRALQLRNAEAGGAWSIRDDKLHRRYQFRDFVTAFGFMAQVALVAERLNHHPEWFNVYRTVDVDLTTHDAGGLSERDFDLAAAMDLIAAKLSD